MKDNATITRKAGGPNTPAPDPQHADRQQAKRAVVKPSIESVIAAIRLDAADDPLSFLLRSDTGHDGE